MTIGTLLCPGDGLDSRSLLIHSRIDKQSNAMGLAVNNETPGTPEDQCLRQSLRGRIPQLLFHTTPIVPSYLGCDALTSASHRIRYFETLVSLRLVSVVLSMWVVLLAGFNF